MKRTFPASLVIWRILFAGMIGWVVASPSAHGEDALPVMLVRPAVADFTPDGDLTKSVWQAAAAVLLERRTTDAQLVSALTTTVRALWTTNHLYLAFDCPFTKLTEFENSVPGCERLGSKAGEHLWNRDVVEVFIGTNPARPGVYAELQVSPRNEHFDQIIGSGRSAKEWNCGLQSAVRVDDARRTWWVELRVPLKALADVPVIPGTRWRANFYRKDHAHEALLAWHPTLQPTFHVPGRFGVMEFCPAEPRVAERGVK